MPVPKLSQATTLAKRLAGSRDDWRIHRPERPVLPHVGIHWIGPIVAIGSVLIGWFAFANAVGDDGVGFALFIGAASILLMAWSNLLSTRALFLEKFFGGLDRMYRWHRWYGAIAVGAMWLHIENVDDVKGIRGASKNIADAAEDLAETGSTLLYILVAISLLRWLPTRWWRLSHKLLVLPYAFACWHFYTSTKPYANNSPWGWWFTGFMILGLAAWVYRVIWRDMIKRGSRYRVSDIAKAGETLTIELEPLGNAIEPRPGQFAFLKFSKRGLTEPHPFTIASSPKEGVLRFLIRDLGDWTHNLMQSVQLGDRVIVEGPYGSLHPLPSDPSAKTVWIAGGVGITPFLAALQSLTSSRVEKPTLFYCIRSRDDGPGLSALQQAANDGLINLHLHVSSEGTRLKPEDIIRSVGREGLVGAHAVMCGPSPLIRAIRPMLQSNGVSQVHVEAFDIRTGIGPDLSVDIELLVKQAQQRVSVRRAHDPTKV